MYPLLQKGPSVVPLLSKYSDTKIYDMLRCYYYGIHSMNSLYLNSSTSRESSIKIHDIFGPIIAKIQ
jgi:hypothetical protein